MVSGTNQNHIVNEKSHLNNIFSFLVINIFHRGPYEPPSRNKWTRGAHLLLEGVRTSIFKETYSHVIFQGGGGGSGPHSPSGSAHIRTANKVHIETSPFRILQCKVHTETSPFSDIAMLSVHQSFSVFGYCYVKCTPKPLRFGYCYVKCTPKPLCFGYCYVKCTPKPLRFGYCYVKCTPKPLRDR